MADASDKAFVDNKAEIPETNLNADREDELTAKSEQTGEVSKRMFSFCLFKHDLC